MSYEGTLDCPALNGVRDLPDVLASYRACGEFDPAERWFIACRGERDVGCLLLADHPDADQWEIVYVGLVPEERGRGSGLALTRHAQWLARQAGRAAGVGRRCRQRAGRRGLSRGGVYPL